MRRALVVPVVACALLSIGFVTAAGGEPVTAGPASLVTQSICTVGGVGVTITVNGANQNYSRFIVSITDGTIIAGGNPAQVENAFNGFTGSSFASISLTNSYPGGIDPPVGTTLGVYYSLGDQAQTPANTGEWFVLYQCGATSAESTLLFSCSGQAGTCPQNASEVDLAPAPPSSPAPTPAAQAVVAQPTTTG